MFYAHFVLAKKGPLARIWLAAHWDKKLTKAHVFETNIQKSVEDILHPKVKIALRTSGHLLLGVVRIYSRKAKYLLADCNEAFVKIKMAFRPGMVDLPEENREAAVQAITLPEVFHDFDANVPDLNDAEMQAQFTLNQSRAEEITMREDYGCHLPPLPHDEEGFGDLGFGDSGPLEFIRDGSNVDHSLDPGSFFGDMRDRSESRRNRPSTSNRNRSGANTPIRDDGFGGNLGSDDIGGGLFEGGLFDDAPMGDVPSLEPSDLEGKGTKRSRQLSGDRDANQDSDDDGFDAFGGPPSVGGASSNSSRPNSALGGPSTAVDHVPLSPRSPARLRSDDDPALSKDNEDTLQEADNALAGGNADQTTLLQNDEEGFALAPVDTTTVKGWARHKRKRKLIVDEVKNISGEEMKSQLSDTSDIVTTLDLAPPTRRLMHWKETGGVEKLFALPGRPIPARSLFRDYQRHLTSQPTDNDDFGPTPDVDKENMPIETIRGPEATESYRQDFLHEAPTPQPAKRQVGRKRKAPVDLEAEAEEHQKRREAQYQSLLAPSPVPPPTMPPTPVNLPAISPQQQSATMEQASLPYQPAPTPNDMQISQSLPQLDETPAPSIPPNEMENMGYDPPMDVDEPFGGLPAQTPGALSERAPPTPWHDDYDMAPSVGPVEEQLADETYEQFEERVLNKRAAAMYHLIRAKLQMTDTIAFSDMTIKNHKKQVAQKFYGLLVLKKNQAIELRQRQSFDEIYITTGPKFDTPSL